VVGGEVWLRMWGGKGEGKGFLRVWGVYKGLERGRCILVRVMLSFE